ncbi:general secretion pathway protein GspK [Pseudomonas mangiferae]|uniref:General secretion pathway protein GspK n=1 Tax=Pseudomonas mangiferae TaxID=2593654 RepID=A0A553GX78_9PSED|nr:general secretion pathway protein GspK [Pseudomonas mangiferae]
MTERPINQRGVVLIVVLWIVALLTVLLVAFSASVKVDRNIASEIVYRARTRAAAEAALHYLVAVQRIGNDTWTTLPGQVLILPFAQGARFRLVPEEAYVSLIGAPPALLSQVIGQVAKGDTDVEKVVEAIVARREGALAQNGGPLQAPADGSAAPPTPQLASIDELMLLPGVSRTWLDRLAPLVTVDGEQTGVDVLHASLPVLRAVTGDEGKAAALYEKRGDADVNPADYIDPALYSPPEGSLYRLQVEVRAAGKPQQVEVTVMFGDGPDGYRIVRWNEYTARFNLD